MTIVFVYYNVTNKLNKSYNKYRSNINLTIALVYVTTNLLEKCFKVTRKCYFNIETLEEQPFPQIF